MMQFRNRIDGGQQLAKRLWQYANRADVVILALPRGGVPVAWQVSQELNAPLDVFVVRKLGVPGHEELAMGAIASGGARVLNRDVIEGLQIPGHAIEAVTARELVELQRRERIFRQQRPAPQVQGKKVILVDDGIATGSTMKVAVEALRQLNAGAVVVAAPTAALATVRSMAAEVDDFIAVMTPADFSGVGQWYEDFAQTSDDEVRALLQQAGTRSSYSP